MIIIKLITCTSHVHNQLVIFFENALPPVTGMEYGEEDGNIMAL